MIATTLDTQHEAAPDREMILSFFETIYAAADDVPGMVGIYWPDQCSDHEGTPRGLRFFDHHDRDQMADYAAKLAATENVYFTPNLIAPEKLGAIKARGGCARGLESELIAVVGLYADVDATKPGHAKTYAPRPVIDAALQAMPLPATIVTNSNGTETGGVHTFTMFNEPLIIRCPADIVFAKKLSKGWQALLQQKLKQYAIDPLHSIAHPYRAAGTIHHKSGKVVNPATIVPSRRYDWRDFEQYLPQKLPAEFQTADNGCSGFVPSDSQLWQAIKNHEEYEDKIRKLIDGDLSPYKNDVTKADYGMIGYLKFLTPSAEQIDRFLRSTKLVRDKWDSLRYDHEQDTHIPFLLWEIRRSLKSRQHFFDWSDAEDMSTSSEPTATDADSASVRTGSSTPSTADAKRSLSIRWIARKLADGRKRLPLVDIVQRGVVDGEVDLVLRVNGEERIIELGTSSNVFKPSIVRDKISGAGIAHVPVSRDKKEWDPIGRRIMKSVRITDTGTKEEQTRDFVSAFASAEIFNSKPMTVRDVQQALKEIEILTHKGIVDRTGDGTPEGFHTPDGIVFVSLPALGRFLFGRYGQRFTDKELAGRMDRIGFKNGVIQVKVTYPGKHDEESIRKVLRRHYWGGRIENR